MDDERDYGDDDYHEWACSVCHSRRDGLGPEGRQCAGCAPICVECCQTIQFGEGERCERCVDAAAERESERLERLVP
jgi:hypothetical protein